MLFLHTHTCEPAHAHSHLFAVRVIEHAVHDLLGQFGLVGVGSSAHPGVNDALVVGALERYLQETGAVTQEVLEVLKQSTSPQKRRLFR